jgi:hypothetical protein
MVDNQTVKILLDRISTLEKKVAVLSTSEQSATGSGVELSDTNPSALGTVAPGIGDEASRFDHIHPMPTAANVGAIATTALADTNPQPLGTAAPGNATTVSRSNHVHLLPSAAAIGAIATSALSNANPSNLGTVNSGVSTNVSRSDHVHTMPTAAQVGVAQVRARLTKNAFQYVPLNLTAYKLTWTGAPEDTNSIVNLANNRITPPAGVYLFVLDVLWSWAAGQIEGKLFVCYLYRNGVSERTFPLLTWPSTAAQFMTSLANFITVTTNGTDYFEIYVLHVIGASDANIAIYGDSSVQYTTWSVVKLA